MQEMIERDIPTGIKKHFATANGAFAVSTSTHATLAAIDIVKSGGSAVDALISAALVQCVVENGSTSLAGAFSVCFFDAAARRTRFTYGPVRGPKAEVYGPKFYSTPAALTGRGVALPGFVDGIREAHAQGGRLSWESLFHHAIEYAEDGFELTPNTYAMTRLSVMPCRYPEGQAIWMSEGRYRCPGERIQQPELGRTLKDIARNGAAAFYQGKFAEHFIGRAREIGGRHSIPDMFGMLGSARTSDALIEGSYRDYECCAPLNAMAVYAMQLNEAADLRGFGDPSGPESIYAKIRIVDEVFRASAGYGPHNHACFVTKSLARERISAVLEGELHPCTVDQLFKTNILIVRDDTGNVAWGTHTINCPQVFGAGIVVDGVYAGYIMNDEHAQGRSGTGFADGVWTTFALYKEGKPALIAGSPGFGFFHGPYQVMTAMAEFGMSPIDAVRAPRFGFGSSETFGRLAVEGHCTEAVFEFLKKRSVDHQRISPMATTGLVGAVCIDSDGVAQLAQDPRRDGLAFAI